MATSCRFPRLSARKLAGAHQRDHAPVGAWLIHRPKNQPTYVDVSVYDAYQPSLVITIGLFDVETGAFVRHLRPR